MVESEPPHIKSIIVIFRLQSLSVARLVKSYVAYVTSPKRNAIKRVLDRDPDSIPGKTTNTSNANMKRR